ncbi:carbon monoxide dehydrogenase [Thalassobius vesicularis]|uniref:Carbon monoxide dehydrogenase n=1 Tax=Thalassobius vesicularis TaxID=1294297 RepID=A0A4S3M566_9RHOB|nr:carbon monoxide dehydrogenase subunit G [Thalassobius vesicularis]THD71740.1 carbon monoxide dehydrogenase [Thalassobius vesicularis]
MELKDTREIAAPRAAVWAALLSADVLKDCVPGCQEMAGSAEDGFEATVVQKVGPVKATFKGTVSLSDIVEGQSLTLSGEGKGGAAGFAKGEAKVQLADSGAGTTLTYEVDAKVGGKLAQLGSRIIDSFAKKMADDFFARFQAAVEAEADVSASEEAPVEEPDANKTDDAPKKGLLKRLFSR